MSKMNQPANQSLTEPGDPAGSVRELALAARRLVVDMCAASGQGYAGQGMELADLLACLYGAVLRRRPDGTQQDHFVLSTGHAAIALFAILGAQGVYERDELLTYGADGTPSRRVRWRARQGSRSPVAPSVRACRRPWAWLWGESARLRRPRVLRGVRR